MLVPSYITQEFTIIKILSEIIIIEDRDGWCMKIQPTGKSFNIFKQYSMGWNYDDNVCLDTAIEYLKDAENIYIFNKCQK